MQEFQVSLPGRGPGIVHAIGFGPAERRPDVVFLHANGFNARTYGSILAPLGETLRVIAFDQRGHGRTTLPTQIDGRRDWRDLQDDLLALLQALDARDAVLSGHSMGGTVAVLATASRPKRVKSLVLFDPVMVLTNEIPGSRHSPMVEAALRRRPVFASREAAIKAYRGRGAFTTWPDEMLADYVADGLVEQPDGGVSLTCAPAWEASGYASHEHDGYGHLARLERPTLIYKAERNSTCRLEPAVPTPPGGLTVEVVPGTSHFLPMERPELVRAALLKAATAPGRA